MTLRSNGSYIGPRPAGPSSAAASGIWDLRTAERQKRANAWTGEPIDPYFASVALLLHMDGSNGSTTFTDSSSNAFTFTATGDAQISTTQSKFGGASGYFDGNGDYLQIPHNAGLDFETGTDFTLEMWLRPDATQIGSAGGGGNAGAVWSGRTGATYTPYEFAIRTDLKMQWLIKGAVNTWQTIDISDTVLVADAWSHLAFVYRNGGLTLYVNGIADSQMSAVAVDFYPSSTNFYIGRGGDGFYHGYIDDLRITKGAGGARYTANFTPPTAAFPDQ